MLPLTLELYDQNNVQHRPPFRKLRFAKTFFGGEDLWLTFVLDRSSHLDYPDLAYGNDVVLRSGLVSIFSGEMRQIDQDVETITVKALGNWVYLDDHGYGGQGKLWCDSRYGRWKEGTDDILAAYTPEKYQIDANDRLFIAPRRDEQFGPLGAFHGALYLLCPYDDIVRVSFDYDFVDPGNWVGRLNSYDASWGAFNNEWNVSATGSGVKDITLDDPRPIIAFDLYYNAALARYAGETGVSCYLKITNLRLWGENGPLSRAIESPSVIHIAEDIIAQLAATPISADDELVQESVLVRDTFTDVPGTAIVAHGPEINKERALWTLYFGNADIQANQANVTATVLEVAIDSGVSDGIVTADFTTPAAGNYSFGLLFRAVDAANKWLLNFGHPGNLELHYWNPGYNLVWSIAIGNERNYTYNLMVKMRGDRIDCYVGGVWRGGTNSVINQTGTRHGLRADRQTGLRMDNFEVSQALPLWPLFYEQGQSCHKALVDASSYGDWDFRALGWGVEPGGDRLYLKRADRDRVRYVIPPRHASRLSARGQTDKGFVTEAWGQFIDEDGVERWTEKYYAHVTPTGIVANMTATGEDLASVVYGVFRERTIPLGRVDAGLAVEYLQRYLIEHGHPQMKSAFDLYGPVQDLDKGGAWIQPHEMEMGYVVQIPHFRAVEAEGAAGVDLREWDTTFLLVGMRYDAERGKARLIPEGASEDLERLIRYVREFERGEEEDLIQKRREASFSR